MFAKKGLALTLAVLAIAGAAPASAQTVREGITAWQKGEFGAAVETWKPLAAAGNADAAFNLGQAYRLGKGVPIDLARAQSLFEQAARKGHIDAATNLGIMLFQSNNRTGAMRWLRQAAEGSEPCDGGLGEGRHVRFALIPPIGKAALGIDVDEADWAGPRQLRLHRQMSGQGGFTRPALLRCQSQDAHAFPLASNERSWSGVNPKPLKSG